MNSDRVTDEIVSTLRRAGAFVQYLDAEGYNRGAGMPDLLVAHQKVGTVLLEVKGPRGRLKEAQLTWHARWMAAGGCPVVVVRDVEGALAACGLIPVPF